MNYIALRNKLHVVAGLCILTVAVGCKRGPLIVGDWHSTAPVQQFSAVRHYHFDKNGTYTSVTLLTNAKGVGFESTDKGTWEMKGTDLSSTVTDVNWVPINMSEVGTQKFFARFKSEKAKIITDSNKEPLSHLKWFGDDAVSWSDSETTIDLHRD